MKKAVIGLILASMVTCTACSQQQPVVETTIPTTIITETTVETTVETTDPDLDELFGNGYMFDSTISDAYLEGADRAETADGRDLPNLEQGETPVLDIVFTDDISIPVDDAQIVISYCTFNCEGTLISGAMLSPNEYTYEVVDDTHTQLTILDGVIPTDMEAVCDIFIYNHDNRESVMATFTIGDASLVSWTEYSLFFAPSTETNGGDPCNN